MICDLCTSVDLDEHTLLCYITKKCGYGHDIDMVTRHIKKKKLKQGHGKETIIIIIYLWKDICNKTCVFLRYALQIYNFYPTFVFMLNKC